MKKNQLFILLLSFVFSIAAEAKLSTSKMKKLAKVIEKSSRAPKTKKLRDRARTLESLGLYHMALRDWRNVLARRDFSKSDSNHYGATALILGRERATAKSASAVLSRSKRKAGALLKAAYSSYLFKRGKTKSAARFAPSLSQVMRLSDSAARRQALHYLGALGVARKRDDSAASAYRSLIPEEKDITLSPGLAHLQLARLYYSRGKVNEALEHLGSIGKDSASWHEAMFVSAWSAFRNQDYNLALGQIMSLRSPYLVNKFSPEIHVLEAASLYALCYYQSAQRSIAELNKRYQSLSRSVNRFERSYGRGTRALKAMREYAAGNMQIFNGLPANHGKLIADSVLSSESASALERSLSLAEREQKIVGEIFKALPKTRWNLSLRKSYLAEISRAKSDYTNQLTRMIPKRFKWMKAELARTLRQGQTIKLETDFRLRDRLVTGQAPRLGKVQFDTKVDQGYEFWPFEGEFWRDELGSYFFITADACDSRGT